ncbi:MAG: 23S rRNA (adenine(2503)-C(2))-methyltransferase RlmN [Elusimicrobiota bacterium]
MDVFKVMNFIREEKLPEYRFLQIKDMVFKGKVRSFSEILSLPKEFREEIERKIDFYSINYLSAFSSKKENAVKFLFELKDGNRIETMIFEKSPGVWVACVSSQVGCPVGCKFCASGKKGLKRNLNYEEITDQVLFTMGYLKRKKMGDIKRIVYMGIGEPLFNYENVLKSIKIFNELFGIGKRHISVSTFGYIPRIRDFAHDLPQVNLAVSLHSATENRRRLLVPMAFKYDLLSLSKALKDYLLITKRKIFFEYVMLYKINDREKDVYNLIKFIDSIGKRKYFTVNLIPYNTTDSSFVSSSSQRIREFANLLLAEGVNTTIRKSFGSDIKGACGQLAIK